jgi:heat-inducible transcriptional repressor
MTKLHDSKEADDALAGNGALGPRRAAILEAVVAEYIGTAVPVGSGHVANAPGVHVSSATVRADMVALEQEGYLVQPHTSAGRIPTDKGYRFFVDHLAEPGVLGTSQRLKVRQFFDQVHGEMEELLEHASGLLSELTSCAAVVVGPSHESAWFRSVQLVGLSPHLALLVVVLSDGAVEKRSIELADDVSDDLLAAVTAELGRRLTGRPTSEVDQLSVRPSDAAGFGTVFGAATHALGEIVRPGDSEHVFVGGPSRLADAFDAMETVRSVLGILEQQLVVVTLLRDVLDSGLSVAIGAEHGYEPLASCAVVVAPVVIDGRDGGAVGLLGPTRMNYPQALAAAHIVGEGLSQRLQDPAGRTAGGRPR